MVLGQAAVEADIVSPILIIIIAITGITSFSIPDYNLGFHLRIHRFVFILLGFLGGFLGIVAGLFMYLLNMCSLRSFGVPYMTPYAPLILKNNSGYFVKPAWKREFRNSALDPKKKRVQGKTSMKWRT